MDVSWGTTDESFLFSIDWYWVSLTGIWLMDVLELCTGKLEHENWWEEGMIGWFDIRNDCHYVFDTLLIVQRFNWSRCNVIVLWKDEKDGWRIKRSDFLLLDHYNSSPDVFLKSFCFILFYYSGTGKLIITLKAFFSFFWVYCSCYSLNVL